MKKPRLTALALVLAALAALPGCDNSGEYMADYMGTSEYDKLMREAIRTNDTRYLPEEYLENDHW